MDDSGRKLALHCGVPWPVCQFCFGENLVVRGSPDGVKRVRCPRCGRAWRESERVPCPDPPTHLVEDAQGRASAMCQSHMANISAGRLKTRRIA